MGRFMSKESDVSVWLVPVAEQEERIQGIIEGLAEKYGCVPFIPHLTLYHLGVDVPVEEVVEALKNVLVGADWVGAEAVDVGYSDAFTKTLFVVCEVDRGFVDLYERLRKMWKGVHDYELNPHMSLAYSTKMSEEEKKLESVRVSRIGKLVLDRVVVIVRHGGGIEKESDVADWKVVFEKKLREE